ncbi:oxidoreductase FAD/NAD(P)-binding domain protein [Nitrosococcus halophilus Nc 4]|uniref:Oxidoreductase FAD/NAD(P)-binding domain protein n=1 Tax=Nitrosococcus halophilus (strain Nc4) TaxID=472759 RepID=D5C4Y8_NITHN|nr:dihydroorotate dehydrogenase electron transfer subunit [Nitrosococcus halophilus]ADE13411.1 oxidoreductase FAD/NAD(P)-binding domain protein [Nitrosococcus halophilus Nc 4]
MKPKSHRGTILMEDCEVLAHDPHPGDQYVLRVTAPGIAPRATPGSFAHLQCDPSLPMRRPLSIMRVDARHGWMDFLYKAIGQGTRLLAQRKPGEKISILGPIGQPFQIDPAYPRPLLLGGGVGIPPMVFLADTLRRDKQFKPLVLMGSEVPFPFRPRPSQFLIPGLPEGAIGAMPLLEDWKIPNRLTSLQGYPGCFEGFITDLARHWLQTLDPAQRQAVAIYACGPHPMLEATAKLAQEFDLPCQVSLEEFMACAVGGCAGCVVKVQTSQGPAMKRVCVDGPVFDAKAVFA